MSIKSVLIVCLFRKKMLQKSAILITIVLTTVCSSAVHSIPAAALTEQNDDDGGKISFWPVESFVSRDISDNTFTTVKKPTSGLRPFGDRLPAARRSNNDLMLGELVPGSASSLGYMLAICSIFFSRAI